MPTNRPNIVYGLPPKRTRRKKVRVEHPNLPTTVHALPPKMQRLVDARKPSPLDDIEPDKAREAADRLWQTIVQEVNSVRDGNTGNGRV
jgi:hypothetical protein